jgi:hypothetical protein
MNAVLTETGNVTRDAGEAATSSRTAVSAANSPTSSPEGRPAHPGLRAGGISAMLALIVAGGLILALLVALVSPPVGIGIAAVSVLALVLNPVFWASLSRAKERPVRR